MLKLSRRGTIWHINGSIRGQRYRESTGTDSRAHAEALLARRQTEIIERETWGQNRITVFAEAVTHYLQQGGEARFLTPLLDRWGAKRLAEISQVEVSAAAHAIYPGRSAAYQVRAVFTPTSAVMRCAARAGLCPLVAFEKPKIRRKPIAYADDAWFQKVLPHCNPNLTAILLFLTLTGARVTEACTLVWDDVDLERAQALLRETKNGTSRVADLAPLVIAALQAIRPPLPAAAARVFGYAARWSVNQAIERACKRAQAPYMSSHRIGRHAFAARLLRDGHSLKLVQEAGGWKAARMVSDHYGHLERSQISSAIKNSGTNLTQRPSAPSSKTQQVLDNNGGRYRDRTCDPYHVKVWFLVNVLTDHNGVIFLKYCAVVTCVTWCIEFWDVVGMLRPHPT
jgi:integrase